MDEKQMLSWMLYNFHWQDTSVSNPDLLPYAVEIPDVPEYIKRSKYYEQVVPRAVCLFQTKIFVCSDTILKFLTKDYTKNIIGYRHLPFESIFIPMNRSIKGQTIRGIGLYELNQTSDNKLIQIVFIVERTKGETGLYVCKLDNSTDISESSVGDWTKEDKIIVEEVRYFVCNLLDFINNPEVELVHIEHTIDENRKRIARGKVPIPICKYVRINGSLKEYFDSLNSGKTFNYSHKFFVRGHFRTLKSNKWKNKVGTKIWIYPYIKGEGILINKEYRIKNDTKNIRKHSK
jgi:hypothetical protein